MKGLMIRVFKLEKSSRRKLQSSRSTIGSLVEWGEQPRPFCREEWEASPGKFKNQGSLINELYSLVCFAPVTDFVDRHCTLINKGLCSNFVKLVAFKVIKFCKNGQECFYILHEYSTYYII